MSVEKIMNSISKGIKVIDDHTRCGLDNFKAIVILGDGRMGALTNSKCQCINELYIDKCGVPHLSMWSISGNIYNVNVDIVAAVNAYNKEYRDHPSKQITSIHMVI